MKILIAVGLLILGINLLVVLMVGLVLVADWIRKRGRGGEAEQPPEDGAAPDVGA